MALNKGYLTSGRTKESDECLTPKYVVEPIIKYLKFNRYKKIWCPFDHEHSLYVRMLKQAGFDVMHTHIAGGGDFLNMDYSALEFDCIVSNPPFTLKDEILETLYKIGKPFAILLPLQSLQSSERTPLYIKYGLELLSFDKRACFYTNNDLSKIQKGAAFASAYFCKNVLPEKLIFETLSPTQEPYFEE